MCRWLNLRRIRRQRLSLKSAMYLCPVTVWRADAGPRSVRFCHRRNSSIRLRRWLWRRSGSRMRSIKFVALIIPYFTGKSCSQIRRTASIRSGWCTRCFRMWYWCRMRAHVRSCGRRQSEPRRTHRRVSCFRCLPLRISMNWWWRRWDATVGKSAEESRVYTGMISESAHLLRNIAIIFSFIVKILICRRMPRRRSRQHLPEPETVTGKSLSKII